MVRASGEYSDAAVRDIVFHMTDWLDDLDRYHTFCEAPEAPSTAEVEELLKDFLVHVPNHLAAASKLYTGIPVTDMFDVGAAREDDEPES